MRELTKRAVLAACAALTISTSGARADAWPTKPVTMMVGFAAGGFADSMARALARKLGERWKQSVVVQNMPGAGGNIAGHAVSIAPPDGYTLLATTTSLAINETLNKNKGFALSSLAPVVIPAGAPELLAGNPKSGVVTLKDAIEAGRAGKLYMSSSGIGSGSHIEAEYFFRKLAKVDVKHIPFPGGNPAMLALLTGDVNLMASTSTVVPSIQSGQLVGIAVGSEKRSPLLPNVPTFAEQGYPGFAPSSWMGLFAPAKAPADVLDAINAVANETLNDAEMQKQLNTLALTARVASRVETTAFFESEVKAWGEWVRALDLQEK